jgi:signal transduction histidine kinase
MQRGDDQAVCKPTNRGSRRTLKNRTLSPSSSGGGLGTALVQSLVKQMDASIKTTSSKSGTVIAVAGAAFEAFLPAAA